MSGLSLEHCHYRTMTLSPLTLDQIAELHELKSIGLPYGIGCGLAEGDWNKYGRLLEDFAERVGERGASVILFRLDR